MRAVICRRYGPPEVLCLEQVEQPVPREREVLIRVHASTVGHADGMMRRGDTVMSRVVLGLTRPRARYRRTGLELAGVIAGVGRGVTRFHVGDDVYGHAGMAPGALADYVCLAEDAALAIKPSNLSHEEAAAVVDGASTALYFLRDRGQVRRGERVLVNGASGSVGSFAVQLAKHFGAEVTGVCSTANIELVRSLGADEVTDYTRQDFTAASAAYDVIFDAVGKSSFSRCRRALRRNGRYLVTVLGAGAILQTLWTRLFGARRAIFAMTLPNRARLESLRELVEAGALKPVVDRRYPLEQVAAAHRYVDQGRKRGNVVITVAPGPGAPATVASG